MKCDKLAFETKPTLSFDFTGGACSTNDNRIILCFPKQNRKQCYKSRSPIPDYWWQFSSTRESIFDHNLTAIALSSHNISGTLHTPNLALNINLVGNNYLFAMGSLDHAKTELLNFSNHKWKESSSYLNHTVIYSFAAFFYRNNFYVIGGRAKNKILSTVTTFNPMTEKWTKIGDLKFPRYDHTIDVIKDKIYIIGGSEIFEYCDLLNDFGCSLVTDARFDQKDYPKLYGFYPSKCELGIFYSSTKKICKSCKT